MRVEDFVVLSPDFAGAWSSRLVARRHLLRYQHPAVDHPEDFCGSLSRAFGPSPSNAGWALWHRPTGLHLNAYTHDYGMRVVAAYGGGAHFASCPRGAKEVDEAYGRRVARPQAPAADPLVADLIGAELTYEEHARAVEAFRQRHPRAFEVLSALEAMLASGYPPDDRRSVVVDELAAGYCILRAKGVASGVYFDESPTLDEAIAALQRHFAAAPARVASAFYTFWSGRARPVKVPDAYRTLLLEQWRDHREQALLLQERERPADSAASGRHLDHALGERWIACAKRGLLLDLDVEDARWLVDHVQGFGAQSTEYKRLVKRR